MGSRGFNSEMDTYLSRRKRDIVVKKPVDKKTEKKSAAQKFLDFMYGETKVEEANEEEFNKELEEKPKENVFTKIKNWLNPKEEEDETEFKEQQAVQTINDDIKEVLKLQNKWLSKLSAKEIKEFKASDDYKRIKELLDKHGLIKKA